MLLLKKEKEQEFTMFKQHQNNVKRHNIVLIELKEKELRPQPFLSHEPGIIVGVLGSAKVGKSSILQCFSEQVETSPTKRVLITSTGFGQILIDTPPIIFKAKKFGQKEITEFVMKTCHVVLLVTDGEKCKELTDHIHSCYKSTNDGFKPHVIVILNKSKPISDGQLDDFKKFYKKQLQGLQITFTNNTTQPKVSRPMFLKPIAGQVAVGDSVNLYKLSVIDSSPSFSDQARFEVACKSLKKDIIAIQPVERDGRWAMTEREWFNFANAEWQKILKKGK